MEILLLGLFLWSLIHLVPSLAQPLKKGWINVMGENGYKITFSLFVGISLVLIVYGWRHTMPMYVYTPLTPKPVVIALMVISFLLVGAANIPSRINTWVRHPQLSGLLVWSIAHLLVNGDNRSIALFGGLGVWAVLEMIFISRREGEWIKKQVPSGRQELKGLAISLVIFLVAALIHPYIAGVSLK
ncbi:MAG: NnrU family protein [Porticoccus sp.]